MHQKRVAIAILVAVISMYPAIVRSAESFLSTNQLVDVGGFKLHVCLAGSGGVTTVFEAGLGEDSSTWNDVQAAISKRALTIAYDRAGLGSSQPSPRSRDARQMAVELHTMLGNLRAPAPFLLVGHSLGGYVLRVFAAMYPREVAGLVFVDPIDEQLEATLQTKMPAEQWEERTAAIKKAVGTLSLAAQREQSALTLSGQQAARAWPLPDVPITLLTGTKKNPEFPGNPLEQDTKLRLHDAFMDRLGRGTHVLVPTSRHYIQNDQPDVVIKAINDASDAALHKRLADRIQSYLDDIVKRRTNPGISVGVWETGQTAYFNAGFADRETAAKATEHTLYRVGSVTKAFTGTALEAAAEMGTIRLDDPASHYLAHPLSGFYTQPTIRQLADMYGGVPHGWLYSRSPDLEVEATDGPFAIVGAQPGSEFEYSNNSYGVIGVALSRALSLPLAELMRRYVFAPLGMRDSVINAPIASAFNVAKPYWHQPAERADDVFLYPMAAAGALSSAADLLRFAEFHLGALTPSDTLPVSVPVAIHSHLANGFYTHGWAQIGLKTSHQAWLTNGESVGGCATVLAVPEAKIAVTVLTNICHGRQTDDIATHLLSFMQPADAGALESVLNGSAADVTQKPPASTITGKWSGTVLINSRAHSLKMEFIGVDAARCALDSATGDVAKVRRDRPPEVAFSCSGPATLADMVDATVSGALAGKTVSWSLSADFADGKAHGVLSATTKGDAPGFYVNFPMSGTLDLSEER